MTKLHQREPQTTLALKGRHHLEASYTSLCLRTAIDRMKNLLVAILMILLAPPAVMADALDQHQWQDRLLILAAPSAEHPALQSQRTTIQMRRDAIEDRDLRIYELVGNHGLRDGEPIEAEDVAELRERFGLQHDDTLMILVGLDGGEKRRASLATPLSEFFLEIDAMPMRQADIKTKRAAGMLVTEP